MSQTQTQEGATRGEMGCKISLINAPEAKEGKCEIQSHLILKIEMGQVFSNEDFRFSFFMSFCLCKQRLRYFLPVDN